MKYTATALGVSKVDLFFRFKKFIQLKQIFNRFDKLLIAVSGGIDSVVLLDLFSRLQEEFHFQIVVAHVNHNLRGKSSLQDAIFVKKITLNKSLNFKCKNLKKENFLNKSNLQEKARDLRYQFFFQVAKKQKITKILTAHQADDQAETFLIRLIRGAGAEGLKGIELIRPFEKEKKISLIRPLLPFSREEILSYAKERKLKWREDTSNKKNDYLRNQVRHYLIDEMKKMNPRVIQSISNAVSTLQEESEFINEFIYNSSKKQLFFSKNRLTVNLQWLQKQPRAIRYRLYRNVLLKMMATLREINREHLDLIEKMILSENKKAKITLPKGFGAFLEKGNLLIKKGVATAKTSQSKGFFY